MGRFVAVVEECENGAGRLFQVGDANYPNYLLHLIGDSLQKRAVLTEIPYQTVWTYKKTWPNVHRRKARAKTSSRAVGTAIGRNPIVSLCHAAS